jgi:hypothetical protein
MRHLDGRGDAAKHHDLVAPVELIGFARRETRRHVGIARSGAALALAGLRIPTNRVEPFLLQRLENANQVRPFATRQLLVHGKTLLQLLRPRPKLWPPLRVALMDVP